MCGFRPNAQNIDTLLAWPWELRSGEENMHSKGRHTQSDPSDMGDAIYRHIVESASEYAVVTAALDGVITTWSTGASKLLGYKPEEAVGQNLAMIFSFEDQLQGAFHAEMRSALQNGRADDNRWHIRRDGSRFWASGLLMPLKDDNQVTVGFVKVLRDRTQFLEQDETVRSSEERLQLILESATDYAIFTLDDEGALLTWNAGAQRILGYERDEIIGRDARILFTREERDAGALEWEMETAKKEGRAENERFHVRKDGSRFWGSGLTMPLKARHDEPGYLKIMRDDTERHLAEEHHQVMLREMSHRVKNSLMLVTGMLAMQARAAHIPEVKRVLTDAETRVATIAAVHDYLWRQPDLETIDLAAFLKDLCHRLAQASGRHTLSFDGTPCRIETDRAIQAALIVNELVTNAFKHAYPSGGGRIDVTINATDEMICLTVADRGVGLPNDFDLDESSRKSLGMRVVKGLVRQLRAELAVAKTAPGTALITKIPMSS
jgi:PAS domain S-box-containing protein